MTGWVSFGCSPFTGDGPDNAERAAFVSPLPETRGRGRARARTFVLLLPAAQVVAIRGSLLELLDQLGHGDKGGRLLRFPLGAPRQVERLRYCGASNSFALENKFPPPPQND